MCRITLIATVHQACGLCNPDQLYRIIERIAPQVIFEEIPPDTFTAVYQGLRQDSLETCTIKRYLQKHAVAHYPVDLDGSEMSDADFRKDCSGMFHTFRRYSHDYNNLLDERSRLTERLGFPYLNSEACSALMERIRLLEETMVQKINNDKLFQVRKRWLDFIDRRRNAMISNIYKYLEVNSCEKVLFLVGTEHRNPIIQKIADSRKINWNFNYFG